MMRRASVRVFLLPVFVLVALCGIHWVSGAEVQFIFGDSLSDVGNNGYLTKSLARAALPWYGIDYGTGMPNGRFTNGRTVADIMGDMMGLPRPPAFMDPTLDATTILNQGVNFASGGGGILNDTANLFIQRFSLYKQIELFQGVQTLIRSQVGTDAADAFFRSAQYIVALGSNDFINNYLLALYRDSWAYDDTSFMQLLMSTLESQMRLLHTLGARKVTFFGLGPMGCIPLQRYLTTTGGCQDKTNQLSKAFNTAAGQVIRGLNTSLPNATFLYTDAFDLVMDVVNNPNKYGFNNSDSPCCSVGRIRPTLTCTPLSSLCTDRSKYVFWDEYHPTDRTNFIIAKDIARQLGIKPVANVTG